MKKLFYFAFFFLSFLFIRNVDANSVSSIVMDVYIDSNGTAHVKETWTANLTSGTEGYKPYYNIGNSEIINFKVTDGSYVYTNIGTWNTSASFNDKSYKNGINYLSDGLELCFGISSYGYHNYILEYDITNFVDGLNDADAVYWTLIPHNFSAAPNSVYIKIYADEAFSSDLDVWGYGNYGGYAYVYDGYIEMSTDGILGSDEYMTILIKFPQGTFSTDYNKVNKNFSEYLEMAEEGATSYGKASKLEIFLTLTMMIVLFILQILLNPIVIMIVIIILISKRSSGFGLYNWKFNKGEKKLPRSVPLYRDIPFNKDIYKTYFLANLYGLAKNKTDLLGAVLLKWIKEGKIEVTTVNSSILKREETAIKFKEEFTTDYGFELNLYNMMYDASKDGILESHELDKWCKNNYTKILKWFDSVTSYETNWLMNNDQIELIQGKNKYLIKTSLYEDAKVVKGLKEFLINFTKINSREAIEVINWEEYLIIAQILGIADKVAKQFKKLYPEVITDYTYNNIIFVHNVSLRGIRTATYARSAAQSRSSSYSSGGGGRSSRGGGGGSHGGGSRGGGGFR